MDSYGGLNCNKCEKCLRTILITNLLKINNLTTNLNYKEIKDLYLKFVIDLRKNDRKISY